LPAAIVSARKVTSKKMVRVIIKNNVLLNILLEKIDLINLPFFLYFIDDPCIRVSLSTLSPPILPLAKGRLKEG
jgi:hypothetical protein